MKLTFTNLSTLASTLAAMSGYMRLGAYFPGCLSGSIENWYHDGWIEAWHLKICPYEYDSVLRMSLVFSLDIFSLMKISRGSSSKPSWPLVALWSSLPSFLKFMRCLSRKDSFLQYCLHRPFGAPRKHLTGQRRPWKLDAGSLTLFDLSALLLRCKELFFALGWVLPRFFNLRGHFLPLSTLT